MGKKVSLARWIGSAGRGGANDIMNRGVGRGDILSSLEGMSGSRGSAFQAEGMVMAKALM